VKSGLSEPHGLRKVLTIPAPITLFSLYKYLPTNLNIYINIYIYIYIYIYN